MPDSIREQIEAREAQFLSPLATLASQSVGRQRPIDDDLVRTCFQRDRDRILHAKSFRRLKHKTQVFIDPLGDHYRTRLTHTLEVAQISRTIGRALRLNEDLIEAIALGHDVGHSPFGHAGERALDQAIKEYWFQNEGVIRGDQDSLPMESDSWHEPRHFRHYEQSLRIVDVLENLNLTEEVRLGISGHSKGRKDLSFMDGEPVSSLEAAVVKISDRIAYLNHDIDDALRSGIIESVPTTGDELLSTHRNLSSGRDRTKRRSAIRSSFPTVPRQNEFAERMDVRQCLSEISDRLSRCRQSREFVERTICSFLRRRDSSRRLRWPSRSGGLCRRNDRSLCH